MITWRKSSHSSGSNTACIEIASSLRGVRDSKAPSHRPLSNVDVAGFVAAVKAGRVGR